MEQDEQSDIREPRIPMLNPIHRVKMVLFIVAFFAIVIGVAMYDSYHVAVLADTVTHVDQTEK